MGKRKRSYCTSTINPFQVIANRRNNLLRPTNSINSVGERKRSNSNANPFQLKDSSRNILLRPTNSINSVQDDPGDFKSSKSEMKMKVDAYKTALKRVNNDWKKIKYQCVKNESASESNSKDRYDVARDMLLFERKSVRPTEDVQPLKILNNIEDFNLGSIIENVSNEEFINDIVHDLHLLASRNNLDVANKFRAMLSDEYDVFLRFKERNKKRNFPRVETVALLAMICRIYATGVTQHPVTLPAMICMSDILSEDFYPSYNNIIVRLYVCELIKNCISETNRYISEPIQFLKSVLDLTSAVNIKSHKFNLIITEKVSSEEIQNIEIFSKEKKLTVVSKKISVIFSAASLTFGFATLFKDYPSIKFAFQPILDTLNQLPVHLYPVELESLIGKLVEFLGRETPPLRHLTQTTKPISFKTFEPLFECKYESIESLERLLQDPKAKDNKNKLKLNKEREKLKRVKQKIRKEERCLLKEIRKSAKATAFVKLEEKLKLDAERAKNTAKIYNELALQEHEFKKNMKKK